jgi:putative oxidoreductase
MSRFFSSSPLWQTAGLTLIRLIVGFFMIYHGVEVFSQEKMSGYMQWDMFKGSSFAKTMVYIGKGSEFVGGLLLFLGLFTRVAALLLSCTMLYISLFVGEGRIWYEDQHPFLFVLLALVFFFTGGGKWSADYLLLKK